MINKLAVQGSIVIIALAVLAGGCSELGDQTDSYDWSNFCTNCHGGLDNTYGSPPPDTKGNTSTDSMTVGAHTIYLTNTDFLLFPFLRL